MFFSDNRNNTIIVYLNSICFLNNLLGPLKERSLLVTVQQEPVKLSLSER